MPPRKGTRAPVVLGLLAGCSGLLVILLCFIPRGTPATNAAPHETSTDGGRDVSSRSAAGASAAPASQAAQPLPRAGGVAPSDSAPVAVAARRGTIAPALPRVAGRIVVVIDDAGYSLAELEPFLSIPARLSVAVLPGLPHSAETARRVRLAGKGVLLHLPMEPLGESDPGPLAISVGMSGDEIRSSLERDLAEVGPVEAINNHMGSRATADPLTMGAVLAVAKSENLVFLDSRTTASSVAEGEAKAMAVRYASRDVFLDNEPGLDEVRRQLEEAKRIARLRGQAVVIGHVQTPGLAELLRAALPRLVEEGYELASVEAGAEPREGEAGR